MFHVIDLATWPRRATFEFFRNFDDPFFNLTAPVNVTGLLERCRKEGSSFFLNSLYVASRAANETEAFRLRLLEDQVVRYDTVHPGSTVLMPDNTFSFAYFNYTPDHLQFIQNGHITLQKHLENPGFDPRGEDLDLLHFSVIPWVSFTSFKHARRFGCKDSIPKIVLGRYYLQGDQVWMPVSVEVHHALADGYHVGLYFDNLNRLLNLE